MEELSSGLFSSVGTFEASGKWQAAIKRVHALYQRGSDVRSEFERDYTRILHCEAFRRLKHKTQVFFSPQNDHVCTRMEHSLHVVSVSSMIAKRLGLNTDLTRAIALGHDIGHAPFGHPGEDILNSLLKPRGEGKDGKRFWHERNSLFFADYIETLKAPDGTARNLGLTYAVRDGLICHCGEIDQQGMKPRDEECDLYSIKTPGETSPFTWEGCTVKASDKIAFLGRDIEDASIYGIMDLSAAKELERIAAEHLGGQAGKLRSGRAVNTTVLINDMISDLCRHSSPQQGICFSDPYFAFISALKAFSAKHIYENPRLLEFRRYAECVLGGIYRLLTGIQPQAVRRQVGRALSFAPELRRTFTDWLVKYAGYDEHRRQAAGFQTAQVFNLEDEESFEKCVVEYISGMSDQYAMKVYDQIVSF